MLKVERMLSRMLPLLDLGDLSGLKALSGSG